jgi:hypothetical protein
VLFFAALVANLLKKLSLFSYNTCRNGGALTVREGWPHAPARLHTKLSTGLFRALGLRPLARAPPPAVFILLLSTDYNMTLLTGTYAAALAPQDKN